MSWYRIRPDVLAAAVAIIVGGFTVPAANAVESDAKAVEVAEHMMKAMGGREAFDAPRILAFRWVVERDGKELGNWLHVWDRTTGRYRLEGKTREGEALRVLFNLNDRRGEVWLGETKLDPEHAATYLEDAYARHINDSYWLLMPWKWLDPGVHLSYEGEKELEGEVFDIVQLTFDNGIGLTPKDRYWGYVSRNDGLMKRWEYVLQTEQGEPGVGEPSVFRWEEWKRGAGGILTSGRRVRIGDGPQVVIRFPFVEWFHDADDTLFNPDPPPAGGLPFDRGRSW